MKYVMTVVLTVVLLGGSFYAGYYYCKMGIVERAMDVPLLREITSKSDDINRMKGVELDEAISKYYRD